jgi:hypothetical protein
MRAAVDAAGGDGAALAVLGTLPVQRQPDRSPDFAATMQLLPPLLDAGVTDFLANVRVPDSSAGAHEVFSELVVSFKAGVSG